jgi:hypothetical protein
MTPASIERLNRKHDFWVTLKPEHAAQWETVLGRERAKRLPIRSPIPILANLPGFDIPQRVFLLALDQLTDIECAAIAAKLAEKFGLTLQEALTELWRAGVPIREEHTAGTIVHHPQRWF